MLADYDPQWPAAFEDAADDIHRVIGAGWMIEHIGSTSIPGMPAKPIIDLAVRVDDLAEVDANRHQLVEVGFVGITAGPRTHRVLVRLNNGERTHVAHFFTRASWATCIQRLFRDWLRANPADRERYEAVKRTAAAEATGGRDYTQRKTAIVQEIVDRARTARGLPLVDVWDK